MSSLNPKTIEYSSRNCYLNLTIRIPSHEYIITNTADENFSKLCKSHLTSV